LSLQPACYSQVSDGQEIFTKSDAVRKAQEGVIEYLLLNHPLDCPVCDKGGECPLQDQAMSHGPGESRFEEDKRHWAKPIEIGPLVLLDRERCIQCARCTRFAEEVAGEPLIDFAGRGGRIEVAIFPGHPFDSYFAGNTIQICPVGALTAKPYRFKSRPWDLEQVETTCTSCAVGCRIVAQSSAGSLVRYLGVDAEGVNQSWLCDRGRFGFEAVESPLRLDRPRMREGSELRPASWDEALGAVTDALAQALDTSGPASIGVIGGARLANEDAYAWVKFAKGVIGTDNFDAQLGDGLSAQLVAGLRRATIAETLTAKTVIVLAGDLREELPVLYLRLRQTARSGQLRVIDCSPVATGLGDVGTWFAYRPGEVVTLAQELVASESGEDVVVILGRPSLAEPAEDIAAAAAVFASAWPTARFLPALRRGNVNGAIDLGCAPGLLPGSASLEEARDLYEDEWGSVPADSGLDTTGMLQAAASGDLSVLVLLGADPLGDFPDRELAKSALEAVDFLVSADTTLNASSMLADVVLPAAGYAERGGTTTNIERRVSMLSAKVVPPGTARADWVIATQLADRLGTDLGFESLEGIWAEIERVAPLYSGCTTEVLRARQAADGVVVPISSQAVLLPGALRKLDPIATPGISSTEEQGAPLGTGATVPVSSEPDRARSDAPCPSVPGEMVRFDPGSPAASSPLGPNEPGSLRLVVRRALYDQGTLVQSAESLASLGRPQQLYLHPDELAKLAIVSGTNVRVRSERGELVVPAIADERVPLAVALIEFNSARVEETSASALIDCSARVTQVRVEAVER
jgi:NADH-quinone oxidoreductase subunit G